MSTLNAFALPTAWNNPGSLDSAFAIGGVAQVYFAGSLSSQTQHVALDAQGRILVAAKVGTPKGSRFGLARLLADGSADLSFGDQGSVISSFVNGFEAKAGKVQVLPDGRILLAGLHYENTHRTLPALAMFDANGQPDRTFGDDGFRSCACPASCPWAPATTGYRRACRVSKPATLRCRTTAAFC